MSEYQKLPQDVRELIDAPLVPFEELQPYNGEHDLHELDAREEGGYKVVLLYQKTGEIVTSRLVKSPTVFEKPIHEVIVANENASDGLHHIFHDLPQDKADQIFHSSGEQLAA